MYWGRFMKKRKQLLLVFASIIIGMVLIFTVARYGWRLFGFTMCDDQYIEVLDVGKEKVSFESHSGYYFPSYAFIGYKAKQKGDTLYIGVKFNLILGVLPKDETIGSFSVPINGKVNQIIQKGSNEKIIWDREEKEKFTLHMIVLNVDAPMLGYRCYLGDEIVTQKKFIYESPDFPLEISKNDFSEDADFSQLRIEFFAFEENSESKIGEFADFNVEWGQTYETVITQKDGVYNLKYQKVNR